MDKLTNPLIDQLSALQDAFQRFYYIGLLVERFQSDGTQEPIALQEITIRQLPLREAVLQQQITETVNLLNELLEVRDAE